uniref:TATA box-binding protein-associated factor RNA polymerase I subunit B n=1 Tax=Plectus sambesii TaxID=2011161 RepID=A0A914VBS6_9BILA
MSSNQCPTCGCENFDLIDGFYFCSICSTQSQTLREVATEGDQGPGDIGFRLRIRKPAEERRKEKESKAAQDEEADADRDEILSSMKNRDYPAFLGQAGQRIATFSRLLKRFGDVMIRDFGAPETLPVRMQHTFVTVQ